MMRVSYSVRGHLVSGAETWRMELEVRGMEGERRRPRPGKSSLLRFRCDYSSYLVVVNGGFLSRTIRRQQARYQL